eukprot:10681316-Karenia_brevis.AAC.1
MTALKLKSSMCQRCLCQSGKISMTQQMLGALGVPPALARLCGWVPCSTSINKAAGYHEV